MNPIVVEVLLFLAKQVIAQAPSLLEGAEPKAPEERQAVKANYFSPEETQCKCGCGLDIKPELRTALNTFRAMHGEPLIVVSGARCPDYNTKVGGAKDSLHMQGLAADLCLNNKDRHKLIKDSFTYPFTGRGYYKTFIHVDMRTGPQAYWVG